MNYDKDAIISIRVPKPIKTALQEYCKKKGISETEYCFSKLEPYFDILMINTAKQIQYEEIGSK